MLCSMVFFLSSADTLDASDVLVLEASEVTALRKLIVTLHKTTPHFSTPSLPSNNGFYGRNCQHVTANTSNHFCYVFWEEREEALFPSHFVGDEMAWKWDLWPSDIETVPSSWVRFLPAILGGEIFAAREKKKSHPHDNFPSSCHDKLPCTSAIMKVFRELYYHSQQGTSWPSQSTSLFPVEPSYWWWSTDH